MEEVPERMPRLRRQYKIQEVIKRRQVMLVQVVDRGDAVRCRERRHLDGGKMLPLAPAKRDRLARAVDKKFAHDRPTGHIDPLWVAPVIGITFRPSGLHSRNFLFGSAEGKRAGLVERRSRATLERITAQ